MEPDIAPLAKRLAEENNVEWRRLAGSGPDGKIVERDVLEYLARVMAGEEALNPTSEPTPEGIEAWPEEDIQAFQQESGVNVGLDNLRATASRVSAEPPAPQPTEAPVSMDLDDDLLLEIGSDSLAASDDNDLLDFGDTALTPPASTPIDEPPSPAEPVEDISLEDDLFLFDDDDVVQDDSPPSLVESDLIFDVDEADSLSAEPMAAADQDDLSVNLDSLDMGLDMGDTDTPSIEPPSAADPPSLEVDPPLLDVEGTSSSETEDLLFDADLPPLPSLDSMPDDLEVGSIDDGIDLSIADDDSLDDFSFDDDVTEDSAEADIFEMPTSNAAPQDVSPGIPEIGLDVPSLDDPISEPDALPSLEDSPLIADEAQPLSADEPEPALFEDDAGLAIEEPEVVEEPVSPVHAESADPSPDPEATTDTEPVAVQPVIPHVVEMDQIEDHIIDDDLPLVTYGTLLRRHIDVSALAEAQAAVGYELGLEDPLEPAPFLVRAAAKVFTASGFGQGDSIALAVISERGMGTKVIRAANTPFKNVVSASLEAIAAEPLQIEDSDLVIADMSPYNVDEAVLNVRSPVLTLGRIMYDSDGHYKSTLSLSGDFPTQQGADFLSRVADLLDQPIRLTL